MQDQTKPPKTKNLGRTNKNKGSSAERYYALKFRELGFDKCITSRYGSRYHDDAKIDLIYIPFNVQVKAGLQRNMNPSKVLQELTENVRDKFPANALEHTYPNLMIHKKQPGRGKAFTEFDELVTMSFTEFSKIIQILYPHVTTQSKSDSQDSNQ